MAKRVTDRRILRHVRSFLIAGVQIDGLVGPTDEGTAQGAPLWPLLSNLMLDVLDKELSRRGQQAAAAASLARPTTATSTCTAAGRASGS